MYLPDEIKNEAKYMGTLAGHIPGIWRWSGFWASKEGLNLRNYERNEDGSYFIHFERASDRTGDMWLQNIRPIVSEDVFWEWDDPLVGDRTLIYSYDFTIDNLTGPTEIKRSVDFSEEKSQTTSHEKKAGASLSVTTETKATVGGEAYGGSVESSVSVSAQASYEETWGEQETISKTLSTGEEVTVPPYHKMRFVGRVYQQTSETRGRATGKMTYKLRVGKQRHNSWKEDQNEEWFEFANPDQFLKSAGGKAPWNVPAAKQFSRRPAPKWLTQKVRQSRKPILFESVVTAKGQLASETEAIVLDKNMEKLEENVLY